MSTETKKEGLAEVWLNVLQLIALLSCVAICLFSSWMAENWFAYEHTVTKTVKEPYKVVTGTVDTYVCYTTDYGSCYHAYGCGSLWKSSYQTTVYEAKEDGYSSCSKCTPRQPTTLKLTKTEYRDVKKTVTETVKPTFWVAVIGCGLCYLIYRLVAIPLKRQIKAEAETQRQPVQSDFFE